MITVFPDNKIKDLVRKDLKVVEISPTPSSDMTATDTPNPIISETPAITIAPTLTPDPNASPLPTDESVETQTAYIIANSGLVVRSGPSKQHSKLGALNYGTEIQIIKEGVWHYIEYQGGSGYVHSNYVVIGDAPPGDSTKYNYTSDSWTALHNSTKILVEKIFYDGVTIYVADIQAEAKNFMTTYNWKSDTPSHMAEMNDAIFAVNGDYFGFRKDGIIIRNGKLLRDIPEQEMAVLYDDGRLEVYFKGEKSATQMLSDGALHTWAFGPILVKDSEAYESFSGRSTLSRLNPRTGIGMIEANHYIIIVADGRQEMSKGLTLEELAKLFEYYECETAYNLDGGASSIMILENEIISSPSGGTERKSTDIIFFQ